MDKIEIDIPVPRKIVLPKPIVKTIIVPQNGKDGIDGKTPTKDELLSIIQPLIPEIKIPKYITKKEILKMIDDKIAELKINPDVTFEMKETEQGTEITINGTKHLIPKAVYGPKLRNFIQLGDTPGTYVGGAGKFVKVNATETGLEYGTVTPSPLTTKGDLYGFDTDNARVPVGADNYVLTANSTAPLGVSWQPTQVGGNYTYYWTPTASDVATYYVHQTTPYPTINTATFTGATNGQLLRTYITPTNQPGITFIPAGEYRVHIHANVATISGKKDTYIRAEIWETNSSGVDIVKIADVGPSTILTAVSAEYIISYNTVQKDLSSSTSRIATKLYAIVSGTGGQPDISVSVGDGTDSNTIFPAVTVSANNFVPYTGATTDVDLGMNGLVANDINISAQTASTIAIFDSSKNVISATTGTYPSLTELTYLKGVTSAIQTQINGKISSISGLDHNTLGNLTVGDVHTQYVFGAGRATPQTIAFGTLTGASTGYLTSTAHATKGKYFLNSAGTITVDELNVRLGIGSASPSMPLSVVGTGYISSTLVIGATTNLGYTLDCQGSFNFNATGYFRGITYHFNGSNNYFGMQAIGTVNKIFTTSGSTNKDIVINPNDTTSATFASGGNIGFGVTATSPSAQVHIVKTTEQLRAGYDLSNYFSTTVGSTGGVTFDAIGAGASFTFSDNVLVPDEVYGISWDGSLQVPTKNAIYDKIQAIPALTDGDKGDITVSGSGTIWTIDNATITLAKQADVATSTVFYRKTAGTGTPEVQTLATLKTDLGLSGTNSGDQTSIVGITGTIAQYNTSCTDADFATIAGVESLTNKKLGSLTSNGFVKTSGGDGTLSVDTNTYITGNQNININGDATGSGTTSISLTISNDVVTYAKIQNVSAASKILGRGAGSGSGDVQEITLGTNISMSGTTLNVTGFPVSGQADVNFGANTQEDSYAVVTVNTSSVTTSSIITVSPSGVATSDHDSDDYQWDNISGYVKNIVNGISFDIIGIAPNGSFGAYTFNYVIN